MSKKEELDKTILDKNIESELDKTLDATIADATEVGATIKAATIDQSRAADIAVTLVDNSDNSQTFTIQKQSLTYLQETVFAADNAQTLVQGSTEQTLAAAAGGRTVVQPEGAKTVDMSGAGAEDALGDTTVDAGKTLVNPESSDETVAGDKTIVDPAAERATVGASEMQRLEQKSQGFSTTGSGTSGTGGTVSFSGGSISVNVRPRNVSSTLGGDGKSDSGLPSGTFSDFELLEKLGEGGMGVVYSARQSSIDRSIALKMIKSDVVSDEAKSKFLVEAVVTGDLDHPNIVPVHDLGVDSSGNIFYAMKQVAGVEWSSAIKEKSRSENIEILLRVCDAIAFAHDRGVIHRDLKPENVMLGTFGEVLVMDWGLALAVSDKAKAEAVGPNTGIAGTPAYLAPEMARAGAWKMLSYCSDIYLLGAILFEIITGKRAHTGKNVRECLKNAAKNIIVEVEQSGELIDIAYTAMATNPSDRYQSVQDFQKAIREYLSHSESVTLADKAESDLKVAEMSGDYDDYAKALFGFRQAVELWRENSAAAAGETRAGVAYARAALGKGDLDLGLSLVTEAIEFTTVKNELLAAKEQREKHQRRLKLLTRGVAALGVVIVIISVIAAIWIQAERAIAIEQREEAIKQEKIAVEQREEAQRQEQIAVVERKKAQRQEQIAVAQREEAKKQTRIAEEQREEAQRQEQIAVAQREEAKKQTRIAEEQREEAQRQEQIAIAQREEAKKQTIIAEEQREEAQRQEKIAKEQEAIANEKKLLAEAESKRANEQARIAEERRQEALRQEKIALEQRQEALRQEKIAKEQRTIALHEKEIADAERQRAEKSEQRALEAVEKMVSAQTQEQLERARREAAELTAQETQEELSSRDELKENKWWVFGAEKAKEMQQETAAKYDLPVDLVEDIKGAKLAFKLIPPGLYGMGTRVDEVGRSSEEYLHRVEISRPFYMAENELTLRDWMAITGEKDSGEGDYPVWNISYTEVKSKLLPAIKAALPAGWEVRLPTEAEWEWAARAGTNTPYYNGSSKDDLLKIGYTGAELLTSAKKVKELEPNAWGLYDMIGNLAEWCEDMYVRDGYLSADNIQIDPIVSSGGKHYVVRGGAWSNLPEHCRVGYRSYANKDSQYNFLGIRLVLLPPEKK